MQIVNIEELTDLLARSRVEIASSNYNEAEKLCEEVLSRLNDANGEGGTEIENFRATAKRIQGRAAQMLGDFHRALDAHVEAHAISSSTGDNDGIAESQNLIGQIYEGLSDYKLALEYFLKSLDLSEQTGDKRGVAANLGSIGNVYTKLSDYVRALEFFGRALAIHEELGNQAAIGSDFLNIGIVYFQLSDYVRAMDCYVKALAMYEQLESKTALAITLVNIGILHSAMGDQQLALEFMQKALAIHQSTGDRTGIANVNGNIGAVYFKLSEYELSLEYHKSSLLLYEEIGSRHGLANALGNVGVVLGYLKDFAMAFDHLHRALQLSEELGEKSVGVYFRSAVGDFYADESSPVYDPVKAEKYLRDSIAISEQIGSKSYEAHKILAALFKRQKRWEEFAEQIEKYYAVREEVQTEEARKKSVLMQQQSLAAEREKQLSVERAHATATQDVLHKVLPSSVAARLVKGERVADYFQNVSILFADIVGFTPIASRMPARAVLGFLNFVFGEFDRIVDKHGCEKIKTIGDGYLAVAGAPVVCEDHAEKIARVALEMMNDIALPDEIRKHLPGGVQFSIRIGIHTGPCFGGIVGEKRFVYDIYSDAVNIAARMESHGEAGKIHVSDEFAFHLQNRMDAAVETQSITSLRGIRFVERDEMEIKGKGMMRTYFLEKSVNE